MFQWFEKSWKFFWVRKMWRSIHITKIRFLILNLPHNTGVFEFFLSIIELLHPSLKNFFDNLNGYMVGYRPRNHKRAQNVFVVKRRSRAALDDGNRMWYIIFKHKIKPPTPTLQNLKIPHIEIPVKNMYNIKDKTNGEIQWMLKH